MIWVFGIISLTYVLLMMFFLFGFGKVPNHHTGKESTVTGFSIVIPFRNEEEWLPGLLASLKELKYPESHYEVLLVNDHSEDTSEAIAREFMAANPHLDVKLLLAIRSSGSPKKDALKTAIQQARFPYILSADADCQLPKTWLLAYNSFIVQTDAALIAGPVDLNSTNSFLSRFQEIDNFSLQAASIGAFGVDKPFMCNGANLGFRKADFISLNGYEGNDHIASGDDIFLLEKFKAKGLRTDFLKNPDATVITTPQSSLKNLFSQRIRWASKSAAYSGNFPKLVGISVFLMNLLLVFGLLLWAVGFDVKTYLLFSFLLKFNTDFMLIYRAAHFFGKERSMKSYFWASILYPVFCSSVVILSVFAEFQWKGRSYKR